MNKILLPILSVFLATSFIGESKSLIHGTVLDIQGNTIPNASVIVNITNNKSEKKYKTNLEGKYWFNLEHGHTYNIRVNADDYVSQSRFIDLPSEAPDGLMDRTPINFKLRPVH